MVSSDYWTAEDAAHYDADAGEMFAPAVLDPVVDFLSEMAGEGRALEFAVGTGRVAIPLLERGVPVHGIELSQPMTDRLREKIGPDRLPVTVGDMATTVVEGEFSLVYLVFNTLGNLRTQAEQVACFRNAAGHLEPGGLFVIELGVPSLRRMPPGQTAVPFDVSDHHVGMDTLDPVTQQGTSHHYRRTDDGAVHYGASNFRYAWPSECDLMAQLAGLEFVARYADWQRHPFTAESESHVSVWRKSG
ncbi:class I SAM-dependent methyltransferase [Microbacterium sp. BK668]|uniref:class I SAM-dependent DNA methyltransferase n=1 Tax=Microbacterium sp. BK668 TaxID=2512118 RepID=UPI00105EA3F0|nr:class I SAM-dependent methyltransferase [Microbacterium sp. BK668]TDN91503.1 methyltransferase family protein [Microbacterium sp. BK668]